MSPAKLAAPTNFLLASLSQKEYVNVLSLSKLVELNSGEIIGEPGQKINYVYFPINCYISLQKNIDNKSNLEIGIIGPEGFYGLNLVLGVGVTLLRAVVEASGTALSISSKSFLKLCKKNSELTQKLHNYTYVRMSQLSQTTGCNRFHVLDARLCRWILMVQDCLQSSEFYITHECLSKKLGVRRAGITKAAGILQKKKLISYNKGHIKILDRSKLEVLACGCYQLNKETFNKIIGKR
jgi:CRP-like cAMP-binding protein